MKTKNCYKCKKELRLNKFKFKKHKACKNGGYVSGICISCENIAQRERDSERRKSDKEYVQRTRDRVRKYQKTEKGILAKRRRESTEKYRLKRKKYRETHKAKENNYQHGLERLKKDIETLSDQYVITNLLNPHNKIKYTREEIKANLGLIEIKRAQILNNRIRKAIETSGKTICRQCKKVKPISEFRKQMATTKKVAHLIRLCKDCRRDNNKKSWENERHRKFKKSSV